MKELNINILRSPAKSTVRRFLGVIYSILGILWLLSKIILKDPESIRNHLSVFDIIYSVFLVLSGIIFLLDGYGISISKWFGEAYIKIDLTRICIKKGVLMKEWFLLWSEIEQVEFTVIKIKFTLTDKSIRELNYDNIEFEHIQAMKQSIKAISAEKNIRVISPA
jgi:hypothetical protein